MRQRDVRQIIIFSLAAVPMGVIGAVTAWLLYHLIMIITGLAFYGEFTLKTPIYPPTGGHSFLFFVIPVVGALIVGVMARYGSDRIRGHGIPEAMEAVVTQGSKISGRVAIFKPISAAIAVGSGGPFGAEGPIIQTGGAIGSLIGQALHLSAKERRILLACGAAAGMVGIFNTPLAAVAIALELLLFEFRARSLVPVVIASATAAACRTFLLGSHVMFHVSVPVTLGSPANLGWLAPLGVIVGVCAVLISKALYQIEEFFDNLHVSLIFKPAMGAAVLGLVAMIEPRVLGMGYTVITNVLDGKYNNPTVAILAIGKAVALVFSLGAGTSGGLLAPMLLIGAGIGVGYGRALGALIPGLTLSPAMCGIVAMSGLFSAAARAPLTSFLFAYELTGQSQAIVPLMIGCMVAEVTARALMRESVMTERLSRRGVRISQDLEADHLAGQPVREIMRPSVAALLASLPLADALRMLAGAPSLTRLGVATHDAAHEIDPGYVAEHANEQDGQNLASETAGEAVALVPRHQWTFPVVNEAGSLVGIVTRGELLDAAEDPARLTQPVSDFAKTDVRVALPNEPIGVALERLAAGDYGMLPVVSDDGKRQVIGAISRSDAIRLRSQSEEDGGREARSLALIAAAH
ncbi:MAG TPA: chloride channel protein [Ktedonobacterales bacterium]